MSALVDQMTKYERDLLRSEQKHPAASNADLKPWIAELWDWERYQRSQGFGDSIETFLAGRACGYPGWTRDQLRTSFALQNLNAALNQDLGFNRRLVHNDPSEFARGLFLGARLEWLRRREEEQQGGGMAGDDIFVAMLALPLMDMPLIERVIDAPAFENDPSRQLLYEGIRAVLRREPERLIEAVERFNKRKVHPAYQGMRTCLTGISRSDAALVAQGLDEILADENSLRKRKESRGYSREAHELYGLAAWVSPDLVGGFDVNQGLPWDAGLHAYIAAGGNPLEGWELRDISPVLHDALFELKPPPWWRQIDEPELPTDPCRLVLTSLGPTPGQVREFLPLWLQTRQWPSVALDVCPVVIAAQAPRAQAAQLASSLRRIGASAEVEKVS